MRTARTDKMKVDLSKPLDLAVIPKYDDTCFGKEWDMSAKECQYCADNEVCGVLFSNRLKNKVEKVESEHTTFLDLSDFEGLNEDEILAQINGITSAEFVALIKRLSNTEDDMAVVEWIKRFVRSRDAVFIKDKVVHVRV